MEKKITITTETIAKTHRSKIETNQIALRVALINTIKNYFKLSTHIDKVILEQPIELNGGYLHIITANGVHIGNGTKAYDHLSKYETIKLTTLAFVTDIIQDTCIKPTNLVSKEWLADLGFKPGGKRNYIKHYDMKDKHRAFISVFFTSIEPTPDNGKMVFYEAKQLKVAQELDEHYYDKFDQRDILALDRLFTVNSENK